MVKPEQFKTRLEITHVDDFKGHNISHVYDKKSDNKLNSSILSIERSRELTPDEELPILPMINTQTNYLSKNSSFNKQYNRRNKQINNEDKQLYDPANKDINFMDFYQTKKRKMLKFIKDQSSFLYCSSLHKQ